MANQKKRDTGANHGFEENHWQAADKLRNNTDSSDYKYAKRCTHE